ncbi:carboxypeptidase regulatory-like domain-containing protein [Candidatus Woesearchaeota archaeon]|nr:carboxypeptidase regulatory-like domain-containing protein [Candidatus Woesearchaeota archaeon]
MNRNLIKILYLIVLLVILPAAYAGSWSGYVFDSGSLPLSAVNVSAYDAGTDAYVSSASTDSGTGFFNVTNIANSVYLVSSKTGYTTDTTQALPPAGTNDYILPFNITLSLLNPPGTISGTVDNETSDTIDGATVRVLDGGSEVDSTTTNALGSYTITGISHGTYTVEASASGYITQSIDNVVVEPGQTTDVDFTLLVPTTCTDNDGDGYGAGCALGDDFDDNDPDKYPGASCSRSCYSGSTYDTSGACTGGSYTCGGGGSCFPAGTKILMEDGSKNIEDVEVGDKVIGFDGHKNVLVEVLELESPVRDHMYTLYFEDGSELDLTREHPLYTEEGWKSLSPEATADENAQLEVDQLKIGDKVLNKAGKYVEIVDIDFVKKIVKTYNLKKVSEYNNFFANGFLAHNKGSSRHRGDSFDIEVSEDTIVIQEMQKNDYANFDYEGDSHKMTVVGLTKTSATIKVESIPVTVTLYILGRMGFNLDDDLMNDLFITLKSISNNKAEFEFEMAAPSVIPELPIDSLVSETEEDVVDVPEPERNPITIIVEDAEYVQGEEDKEETVQDRIRNVIISVREKVMGILYLKYILAGVGVLVVLIVTISVATKLRSTKKVSAKKREGVFKRAWTRVADLFFGEEEDVFRQEVDRRDELKSRLRALEKQIKDLKKAI